MNFLRHFIDNFDEGFDVEMYETYYIIGQRISLEPSIGPIRWMLTFIFV